MKPIMRIFIALLVIAITLLNGTHAGNLRGLSTSSEKACIGFKKAKFCKRREDCAWIKASKSCATKKGWGDADNVAPPATEAPTPTPTPATPTPTPATPAIVPQGRCRLHDHTKPLLGGVAPFAWKTNKAGGRNALNRFSDRIANSCCAVSATEATTLTWAEFIAAQDPWCVEHEPVTVPCGTKVLVNGRELGGKPITLAGLYVEGELEFVDDGGDVELRTNFVLNCGVFRAGTPDKRYESELDVVLTGEKELWWRGSNFGKTGFVTHGGETYLRSASCEKTTWTRLSATAAAGATELTVQIENSLGADTAWRVGDQLLVTSTGFHVKKRELVQSEVVTIAGFKEDGNTVELAGPLQYLHLGCEKDGDGRSAAGCVMAAEVAPLSRNVQVRGEDASQATEKGGHFMMSHTNHGTICGVEFGPFLGQKITKGKYPLHLHAGWYAPKLTVRSNAVHDTFNRGMVIHAMREMTIVDNTVYNTLGHNFMLEDGVEERNKLVHNLGVLPNDVNWSASEGCCVNAPADDDDDIDMDDFEDDEGEARRLIGVFQQALMQDAIDCPGVTKDTCGNRSDGVANAFWIPNPRNSFIDNTGVAEQGRAFRIETRSVLGDTALWFRPEADKVGRKGKIKNVVPLGFTDVDENGSPTFNGYVANVAHSSQIGFHNYPMLRPSGPRLANYDQYVAYRNHLGISVRNSGRPLEVTGATLIENNIGVSAHISKSRVKVLNSRIVGSGKEMSLPFKMRKTKDVQKTIVSVIADEETKHWARCHGGFIHKDAEVLGVDGRGVPEGSC